MKTLALLITLTLILFSCGTNPLLIEDDNINKTSMDTVVFKLTTQGRWYYIYNYNTADGIVTKRYIRGDFVDPNLKKGYLYSLELTNLIDTTTFNRSNKIYTIQDLMTYDYKGDVADTVEVVLLITKGMLKK